MFSLNDFFAYTQRKISIVQIPILLLSTFHHSVGKDMILVNDIEYSFQYYFKKSLHCIFLVNTLKEHLIGLRF